MNIEIHNLTKTYNPGAGAIHALRGVSLEIQEGMFGLLGPNGAGKTTLMRILAGLVNPTQGLAMVGGIDVSLESCKVKIKSMLGYLPQEMGIYPELTARQFVDYIAILKGVNDSTLRQRKVSQVLELVALGDSADRKLKGFSGGMKRRVGIAQALVNDPKILIVDEPTAGLDPEERIRFRNLLVDLAMDKVVLLSTHIVEDIGQTCRDMAVLSAGEVLYHGSPTGLVQAAQGKVWTVTASEGQKPDHGLTVVSMLHLAEGTQYRVVGQDTSSLPNAQPVQPSLEDGYVWLMKKDIHTELAGL